MHLQIRHHKILSLVERSFSLSYKINPQNTDLEFISLVLKGSIWIYHITLNTFNKIMD